MTWILWLIVAAACAVTVVFGVVVYCALCAGARADRLAGREEG